MISAVSNPAQLNMYPGYLLEIGYTGFLDTLWIIRVPTNSVKIPKATQLATVIIIFI